jgi:hypothetical protein
MTKRLIRKASTFFVSNSGSEEEVKDTQLLAMLTNGSNTIEVLDDNEIHEAKDELTGLFADCYHIKIHSFDGSEDNELWEGYVTASVVADIENAEYNIEER